MSSFFISIDDLPKSGRDFIFDDIEIWKDSVEKFKLEVLIKQIKAEVFIQPIQKGCFIKGRLTGVLEVPCYRCNELTDYRLDFTFRIVERLDKPHALGIVYLKEENNRLKVDMGGILWEQFVLAQPLKYLCSEECKGLCPVCGFNLNLGDCGCKKDFLDPRMEIFRKLKINNN